MSLDVMAVLRIVHLVAALLMAAPLKALTLGQCEALVPNEARGW